ncbi:hypothetical protein GF367_04160, partial [Candidatus Woesearchaeota archaeon]|nr:hypothetical protein [Candidatus Woesearchaeota archaeon]
MNVKKAVKRIAALAAGTTMVTATIMGAMAYDLADYPEPFVENGVFGGKLVIGQAAEVADVIGAIDIAASLQAAAVTPVEASGSTTSVSVSGGVQIKDSSEDVHLGDDIASFNDNDWSETEFPDLLADGIVEDDDGTEYDYEQAVALLNATVGYAMNNDYSDDPIFYLDLNPSGTDYIEFHVDFKDNVNATELDDSETIEMFGKTYTFDPDNENGEDFVLFGSDQTVTASQDEPVTVQVDGEEYTIEILGGNTDDSTAIVRVTGDGTTTKTLEQGDSRTMAGLDLYISDVFISNIGEDTISVSIFVGSSKIIIPDASTSWEEIELNDEDDTDIYGKLGGNVGDLTDIYFKVSPSDFLDPSLDDDEWDWLPLGQSFEDPLFDFELSFDSLSPSIASRTPLELERAGDGYTVTFVNNDGDEYDFEVLAEGTTNTITNGEDGDFVLAQTNIDDGQYYILESDAADTGDRVTYFFEVRDVDNTTSPKEVDLKNLIDGTTSTYEVNDEIEDTNIDVDAVPDEDTFTLSSASASRIIHEGGLVLNLDTDLTDNASNLTIVEDAGEDGDDITAPDTLTFAITHDNTDDKQLEIGAVSWGNATSISGVADDGDDYEYGMSAFGTWYELETDNSGDYLKVYYAEEETDFLVFLNGPDAVVVTSGGDSGDAYVINEFVVGQIAVYDDEAMSL